MRDCLAYYPSYRAPGCLRWKSNYVVESLHQCTNRSIEKDVQQSRVRFAGRGNRDVTGLHLNVVSVRLSEPTAIM